MLFMNTDKIIIHMTRVSVYLFFAANGDRNHFTGTI